MRLLLVILALVLSASSAFAQTNVRVLGVGKVAFDVPVPTLADAQAQTYKAYMPATATTGIALTVTCATASGTHSCTFPLSALPLDATFKTLAITASITAPDGSLESAKSTAPFALSLAGPPVAPLTAMSIRPATP